MQTNIIKFRRPVKMLLLLAILIGLLGGCTGWGVKQGEKSRIPDTSLQPTATKVVKQLKSITGTPLIALPTIPPLPSKSIAMPTEGAELLAYPTTTPLPTGTATRVVIKVDPSCLVGIWQVADLSKAMAESFQQSESTLQIQRVEGQASYVFDPGGSMTIAFSHLAAKFKGTIDGREVSVVQGLDGSGSARYQVDPAAGQVVFSDFGGQGLLSTLDINNQRIAEGNIPVWRAFTSSLSNDTGALTTLIDYSRASVTCGSGSMTIQAIEPYPGPLVHLSHKK